MSAWNLLALRLIGWRSENPKSAIVIEWPPQNIPLLQDSCDRSFCGQLRSLITGDLRSRSVVHRVGGEVGSGRLLAAPPGNRSCAFRCSAHVCDFCAPCLRRYKEVCKVLSVSNTMSAVYVVSVFVSQCVSLCVWDTQSGLSAGPLTFWGI